MLQSDPGQHPLQVGDGYEANKLLCCLPLLHSNVMDQTRLSWEAPRWYLLQVGAGYTVGKTARSLYLYHSTPVELRCLSEANSGHYNG